MPETKVIKIESAHREQIEHMSHELNLKKTEWRVAEVNYKKAIESGDKDMALSAFEEMDAVDDECKAAHKKMWDYISTHYPETSGDELWWLNSSRMEIHKGESPTRAKLAELIKMALGDKDMLLDS